MPTIITLCLRAVFPRFGACVLVVAIAASGGATAQQPAERQEAALAHAQCMRDNGFTEFPDPSPDGRMQLRVTPESAPRFEAAAAACRDLAPEGLRGEAMTPEQLEGLLKLSQCVRENGIPDFPDPKAEGNFDLSAIGIGPGDQRLEAAMEICRDEAGLGRGGRIMIGG